MNIWEMRSKIVAVVVLTLVISISSASLNYSVRLPSEGSIYYSSGQLERLYVEKSTVRDQFGPIFLVGCNVRGQAHPPSQGFDDPFTLAEEDSTRIQTYGFNIVRLVCNWAIIEKSTSPTDYTYNITVMQEIRTTIQTYNSKGIYVILDVHSYDTVEGFAPLANFIPVYGSGFGAGFFTGTDPNSGREHLARLWETLNTYVGDINGVLYDILNEPMCTDPSITTTEAGSKWLDIADYVIARIRTKGDNHICLVNMAPWPSSLKFLTRLLNDSNVIYEPHFYLGISMGTWTVTQNDIDALRTDWDDSVHMATRINQWSNVPFLIGEFSSGEDVAEGTLNEIWINSVLTLYLERPNIQGWIYWCYINYGGAPRSGGWMDEVLAYAAGKPTTVHFV